MFGVFMGDFFELFLVFIYVVEYVLSIDCVYILLGFLFSFLVGDNLEKLLWLEYLKLELCFEKLFVFLKDFFLIIFFLIYVLKLLKDFLNLVE